jgi:leader peptidase (prepilin peptidase)/N-methyltransferase
VTGSAIVWTLLPLVPGATAGYLLNKIALVYFARYGEEGSFYGGFVGALFKKKEEQGIVFSADMVAVEAAASILSAAAVVVWGIGTSLLFILPIIYLILLLSLIDCRLKLLPDQLNGLGIVIGFGYALFREGYGLDDALFGMAAGAGFSFATALLYALLRRREGLGMGDVKLLAFFGTFAGWQGVMLVIMLGSFFGALWGLLIASTAKKGELMAHELPFGPFLGFSALFYLFSL